MSDLPRDKAYAVVTGASRGLGRDLALSLSARGYHTILVGTGERIQEVCAEIRERYHTESVGYAVDLSKEDEVLAFAAEVNAKYEVSVLVNNAGVGGTRGFADAPVTYLDNIINLNVRCVALLTHELLPNLLRQPKSHILNVGSMAAHTPTGFKTVYPASKSFVLSFSLGLREELRGTPVTVSVCSPGAMATNPEVTARIQRQGVLGRLTLKSTSHIARKCVRQMLWGKRLIVFTPVTYLVSRLVPNFIKTPVLSRIVRRELRQEE